MNAIPVTKPATVSDVFHLALTLSLSIKKKTVEANIAADTSQKETPVRSLVERSPLAANDGSAIALVNNNNNFIYYPQ
tara:strand:+ start:303 stop:536 length:234 start_codon:yes stop_codon:yes gene_type:complete